MGMCLALHSVSDDNIERILDKPELIWRLIAADDPEMYLDAVKDNNKPGFLARLFGKTSPQSAPLPQLTFIDGENLEEDLDKAWQGIHYCLNQTAYEATPPMDFITLGGEVAGEIEVGIGPARMFRSPQVKAIHQRLSDVSTAELKANFKPNEMDRLDIYPNIWERDGEEGFEYIADYFNTLKAFLSHCVNHNLGMTVYLC